MPTNKPTIPVLERILDPITQTLTKESAQAIVNWRADDDVQAFVEELARKNTEGQLSDDEKVEYQTYVSAATFVAIMQSKARAYLAQMKTK